jgi:hypothetical protein
VLFVLCFASIAAADIITDWPPDFTGMVPSYEVTEVPSKYKLYLNVSGLYFENGTYNDTPVYQCSTSPYAWLWKSDEPNWVISLYPGNWSMWVWKNHNDPAEPEGIYRSEFYSKGVCSVASVPEPETIRMLCIVMICGVVAYIPYRIFQR